MTADISDGDLLYKALKKGACCFLYKPFSFRELDQTLLKIKENGSYLDPQLFTKLLTTFEQKEAASDPSENKLTRAEKRVLEYLKMGLSYKEIAGELNLSFHTVNFHLKRIYLKYSVNSRSELISRYFIVN
jgi:DNA-binding NarL/FixJ family response regulator